jgi:diguanylate cyclase (GGDEF)-like protein/PAS domain S-box-containing protein
MVSKNGMNLNFFHRYSLKTRVTLFTLTIFVSGIWSLAFYVNHLLHVDMQRQLGEQQFATVSILATELDHELQDRLQALEDVAERITPEMLGNSILLQDFLEQRPFFRGQFNGGILVLNPDGAIIADSIHEAGVEISPTDSGAALALKTGKSAIGKPRLLRNHPEFDMAVPILDEQGNIAGTLSGVINLNQPNFLEKITGHRYGTTGGYLLVAPQYRLVVTATDKQHIMQALPAAGINPAIDRNIAGFEGYTILTNPLGVEELASIKKIPVANWYLAAVLPASEAFAPIHAQLINMLAATLLLTLLAGSLTWWMLRRELSPMLSAITTLANLSETNQYPPPLPVTRNNEIGDLISGFNRILETLWQRECALKESETRFRHFFEHNSSVMLLIEPASGEIINANDAAASYYGYPLARLIGMLTSDLNISAPEYLARERMLALSEERNYFIFRHRLASGEIRDVEVHSTPITHDGQTLLFSIVHDITARKQAEQEAAALIQRNKILMDNAIDGIHILDEQGNLIEANHAFYRMLDYTPEQARHLNITDWEAKLTPDELSATILHLLSSHAVFETVNRRRDGSIIDVEASAVGIELDGKRCIYVASRDITERKKAENEIKHLAFYDPLTGLANRRLMTDRMEQALLHARRYSELVVVCMIDLDGFKHVNDQMGHKAGDQLLIEVASRLQECLRQSDTASRFGGDEFAIILGGFKKISECEQLLDRIIISLAVPYAVMGEIAHVTASIGATIFPNDGGTADLLLRHADQAMYEAKQAGKNCYRLFNPSHQNQQQANQATLKRIEKALSDGQITLYYQPQVDCRLGKVIGSEALIRWNHPILGLLSPSEFIPLLEHDDLIITVGEWVIRSALSQLTEWRSKGIALPVSINISARQLHQSNFTERLNELLKEYDSEIINLLEIEILETAALEDINVVAESIRKCSTLGIRVSIDDFGTGFSSLAHLKHLRVDALKIDQSFVLGMLHNPEDLAIVSGVIALASSFRHKVIAEGVESIDQILMLLELGCDTIQGYSISRPMPAERIPSWLASFNPDPLWKLSYSHRPTRDYFELLLAETNHRHWIAQLIESLGDPLETNISERLDVRVCRLSHWYYGEGYRQFSAESWFRSIEPLHLLIHQTATSLCEHRRAGDESAAEADQAALTLQQDEFDSLLGSLRETMAKQYLIDSTAIAK